MTNCTGLNVTPKLPPPLGRPAIAAGGLWVSFRNTGVNSVAKGLCLMRNGQVLVEYGNRRVPIPFAQYRANGYKPSCEKLPIEAPADAVSKAGAAATTLRRAVRRA